MSQGWLALQTHSVIEESTSQQKKDDFTTSSVDLEWYRKWMPLGMLEEESRSFKFSFCISATNQKKQLRNVDSARPLELT